MSRKGTRATDRGVRAGYWLVLVGIAVQLVGIGWDAATRVLDDNPVRDEVSGFDPTGVLVALGMVLVFGGVVWGLAALYPLLEPAGFGAATAIAALAVVSVAAVGLSVAASGDDVTDPTVTTEGVGDEFNGGLEETWADLLETARERDVGSALEQLSELSTSDEEVAAAAPRLVHALGRHALQLYGGPSEALARCGTLFGSGCYGGVLEAYLDGNPDFTAEDLQNLCASVPAVDDFVAQLCIEGLGRGLILHTGLNLAHALHHCDALAVGDRPVCHEGAFLQNIRSEQLGVSAGEPKPAVDVNDPLHPCDTMAPGYRSTCFRVQPILILYFNGNDFADAFRQCEGAQGGYVASCYWGVGAQIADLAGDDTARSVELCMAGRSSLVRHCVEGAAARLAESQGAAVVEEFCGRVSSSYRQGCPDESEI